MHTNFIQPGAKTNNIISKKKLFAKKINVDNTKKLQKYIMHKVCKDLKNYKTIPSIKYSWVMGEKLLHKDARVLLNKCRVRNCLL